MKREATYQTGRKEKMADKGEKAMILGKMKLLRAEIKMKEKILLNKINKLCDEIEQNRIN